MQTRRKNHRYFTKATILLSITADMTIDLSHSLMNASALFEQVRQLRQNQHYQTVHDIVFMSIANSNLTTIPNDALDLVRDTLEYLSLFGNDFSENESETENHPSSGDPPPLFTVMQELKELDMRHCNIHSLRDGSFENLIKLEKLFLSNNYIEGISTTVFRNIPNLVHLDLSHNTVDDSILSRDVLTRTFEGIKFTNDFQFSNLKKLLFLDVSHSKVSILSTPSFTAMP